MGGRGEEEHVKKSPRPRENKSKRSTCKQVIHVHAHSIPIGQTATCYICMYTWLYVSDNFEGYTYLHVHVRMYVRM